MVKNKWFGILILMVVLLLGCNEKKQLADSEKVSSDGMMSEKIFGKHGTRGNLVFFYYKDLQAAIDFYENVIGLERVMDVGFCKVYRLSQSSFLGVVDETGRALNSTMPKTATLAFVTGDVDLWYDHLKQSGVTFKWPLADATRHPTRGFVALDPSGYFLEFETFLEDPQNNKINAHLSRIKPVFTSVKTGENRRGLTIDASIVWLYYKNMEEANKFYREFLGFEEILTQGFTNVYQVGPSAFFGLVDEAHGLHKHSEEKSVMISLISENIRKWYEYVDLTVDKFHTRLSDNPDEEILSFVFFDPASYYLEFNWFAESETNKKILDILKHKK